MTTQINNPQSRLGWIIAAIAGALLFAAFTVWGGIPSGDSQGIFWAQMVLLFVATCAFILLFWHLLLRPLAPHLRQPKTDTLSVKLRQRIALVQCGGLLSIVLGAMWDELWHRSYGIPFGEDFFWRPHLLMYFGFLTFVGVGFWALNYLNQRLKGSFQQRFRSNTIIGLFVLNAAFMLYALTSDPFWHWTFGEDLSAWSVPHLILLLSVVMSLTVAVYLHLSVVPLGKWRTVVSLRFSDALPLLALAAGHLVWLQIMLIDWDQTISGIKLEWLGLYRPEWLLTANLLAAVIFAGLMATRLLRCAGAATAVGVLALAIRFAMLQFLDADIMHFVSWIAALLPLIAIDIWVYYSAFIRGEEPEWRGIAIVSILAMAANTFVLRALYPLDMALDLPIILAIVATGIGMSWLSQRLADAMLAKRERKVSEDAPAAVKPALSFGILGAFVLFIAFFIQTAPPPI